MLYDWAMRLCASGERGAWRRLGGEDAEKADEGEGAGISLDGNGVVRLAYAGLVRGDEGHFSQPACCAAPQEKGQGRCSCVNLKLRLKAVRPRAIRMYDRAKQQFMPFA